LSDHTSAEFRFYEELNDFLPDHLRRRSFSYRFRGTPSVKDAIEAIGVPHTEVDLVLVDGRSVDFAHRLAGGERVAVYPVFERLDIAPLTRLRPQPLRVTRFVLDVHLGKLARYLRLAGFDTAYRTHCDDRELIRLSLEEGRILLSRDVGLLKHGSVTHGHWLRATDPRLQLREVIAVFDLRDSLRAFTRCMVCNGELRRVDKAEVMDRLPPRVRVAFAEFAQCAGCGRVYWPGSHYDRMRKLLEDVREDAADEA